MSWAPPVASNPTFCLDYTANNYGDYGICYYQPAGSAGGGYGTDYSVPVSTPSPGAPYSPPLYRVCDVWQPVTYYYDGDGNLNVEYGAREESCYFTY